MRLHSISNKTGRKVKVVCVNMHTIHKTQIYKSNPAVKWFVAVTIVCIQSDQLCILFFYRVWLLLAEIDRNRLLVVCWHRSAVDYNTHHAVRERRNFNTIRNDREKCFDDLHTVLQGLRWGGELATLFQMQGSLLLFRSASAGRLACAQNWMQEMWDKCK